MTGASFLLISAAATASVVCYMEVGGISVMDSFRLPSHAKKEVVYKQHRDVLYTIETIINHSRNLSEARSRVTETAWPEKVIHVSLARHGGGSTTSQKDKQGAASAGGYSRSIWTSMRTVIRDGSGFGSVLTENGQRQMVIINSFRKCNGGDKIGYTIYIERPGQTGLD